MGKKDDWCTGRGLNNRKHGMYSKESKQRKICIGVFFGISAIIFIVFGGLMAERSVNAGKMNLDFTRSKLIANAPQIAQAAIDLCPTGFPLSAAGLASGAGAAAAAAAAAAELAGAAT